MNSKPNSLISLSKAHFILRHCSTSTSRFAITPLLASSHPRNPNPRDPDSFTSDVEKIYRILRQFHSKPNLALSLRDSGIEFRSGLVSRVLNRCGDAGNLAYSFFLWARATHPSYSPSYDDYKSMLRVLTKMRQFGVVWALLDEMRKRDGGVFITSEVFILLMRRFAAASLVQKAVQVLDEMPKFGLEPDSHVFACLLDALCKNGKVLAASTLFEEIKEKFPLSIKHFTCLLNGWCREGKLLEAKQILVQMKAAGFQPDIVVFNTLLAGYSNAGKMADANALMKEMRKQLCPPDATSYTSVIQALCKTGKMEEASNVFSTMDVRPDIVTYTTMISGYCKAGKTMEAYRMLGEMERCGTHPNSLTYSYILLAHEKNEELEECLELLEKMKESKCFIDDHVYNLVIRLTCKLGDVDAALRVFREMELVASPTIDAYVVMISGLLGARRHVEACGWVKEMVGRGVWHAPHYGVLKEVMNGAAREGLLEEVKDVWRVVRGGASEDAWTIWVHCLFDAGEVRDACRACLEMMDAGWMVRWDTFAKLIGGLKKEFNRRLAAEITEKVRRMAAERNISFKMYKRRGERRLEEKLNRKKKKKKLNIKKKQSFP